MTFYTSPSALDAFFTCPAKYKYMQEWNPIEVSEEMSVGIEVHNLMALLANGPKQELMTALRLASQKVVWLFTNLRQAVDDLGIRLSKTQAEQKQKVKFSRSTIVRIIDNVAVLRDGTPTVIDFKTGKYPWWVSKSEISPRAVGWQAVSYLIPPDEDEEWPDQIMFLVAAASTDKVQAFTYRSTDRDRSELAQAIEIVRSVRSFPRHRGYQCQYCPFFDVCFQTVGWKQKYERKEKGGKDNVSSD